jgi:hypothetical protein
MDLRKSARTGMNGATPSHTRTDFEVNAEEALAAAQKMPPGPPRIEALKKAGRLRKLADTYGVIFAKRGRPLK